MERSSSDPASSLRLGLSTPEVAEVAEVALLSRGEPRPTRTAGGQVFACHHMTKSSLPSHVRPGTAWAGTDGQNTVPFGDTHGCTKCHQKTFQSFQKHTVGPCHDTHERQRTSAVPGRTRAAAPHPRAPTGRAHVCGPSLSPHTLTFPGTLQALERHSFRVNEYGKCFVF